MSAGEFPVPAAVAGRGAVFVEHWLKSPRVPESAYIAPAVFGAAASGTSTPMSSVARRYARGPALHHQDHLIPGEPRTPFSQNPPP